MGVIVQCSIPFYLLFSHSHTRTQARARARTYAHTQQRLAAKALKLNFEILYKERYRKRAYKGKETRSNYTREQRALSDKPDPIPLCLLQLVGKLCPLKAVTGCEKGTKALDLDSISGPPQWAAADAEI